MRPGGPRSGIVATGVQSFLRPGVQSSAVGCVSALRAAIRLDHPGGAPTGSQALPELQWPVIAEPLPAATQICTSRSADRHPTTHPA